MYKSYILPTLSKKEKEIFTLVDFISMITIPLLWLGWDIR